ncbi:DUF4190 domain-containing protein [Catellatospora methionotrophica]|uniref:DUF4190 domain-containing protein n=1 Tax=Catellatospora methionotrophica TaxID=121620 RepID=UPI0033DB16CD
MTDPTAPPPPSQDPGPPPPAFPAPAPLTFGPADPAPAAAAPASAAPAAGVTAPGSPATGPASAAPGQWPHPYQAVGYPTGGWPQVAGQPNPHGATPPPGYAPYPYVHLQRRTNGMAIGAMVTALAGAVMVCFYGVPALILGPVGAILGHVARRKIRQSGEDGDGMALTGIIVGWIATALGLLVVAAIVALFVFAESSPDYYTEPNGAF